MVKDKTKALEHAKKETGTPPGWIQGDWIRSMLRPKDLEELAVTSLIAAGAARLPEGDTEPQPRSGECVLLATHVDRGFSLPPHPFSGAF